MSNVIINNVEVHLVSRDGLIFANSLDVASVFEKEHAKVIRSIEAVGERGQANFGVTSYDDSITTDDKIELLQSFREKTHNLIAVTIMLKENAGC